MKSISFQVHKGGRGYVRATLKPNHSKASRVDVFGLVLSGVLLLLTGGFVCVLAFALK